MKKTALVLTILVTLSIPLITSAEESYQIRPKYSASMGQPGSLGNPYIVTDRLGREVQTLRPKYGVSLDPGNPDYDPGGRFNPLHAEGDNDY